MTDVSELEGRHRRGTIGETISRSVVVLLKETMGRGPTKCRTYIEDELIIVLLKGGFSRAEQTLFEDGKWLDVRALRHSTQDTLEGRLTEIIERETGRSVIAFMSASHQGPDLQIEAFLLERAVAEGASSEASFE